MPARMSPASRTVALFPWFKLAQNLLFWQAIWFLYFQKTLTPAEALLLYAIFDVSTTVLEVPSGYLSDKLGRRLTLILAGLAGIVTASLQAMTDTFVFFAIAQVFLGASMALASGTDSAILYESLEAEGRGDTIEVHEFKAFRATYLALALSAVMGGALALWDMTWAYWATALAFAAMVGLALGFAEPPRKAQPISEWRRLAQIKDCFQTPVLLWLFVISALMYAYSHVPFVFGQPFIDAALKGTALETDVTLVSGIVTAVMMGASILASWGAPALRKRMGIFAIVLLAFGLQILVIAVLALTNASLVIAILFLRMVPNALSTPFITAHIQPILPNEARATFLSLKSLAGRLFFAATVALSALATTSTEGMVYAEIRLVLGAYAVTAIAALVALAVWARRLARQA